jgi:hypothetical protein
VIGQLLGLKLALVLVLCFSGSICLSFISGVLATTLGATYGFLRAASARPQVEIVHRPVHAAPEMSSEPRATTSSAQD